MGTRYFISVLCPKCELISDDVYYAPTCDFVTFTCDCGTVVDLIEYTGISYEEASNKDEIEDILKDYFD